MPQNIEVLKVGHHGAKGVVDNFMLNRVGAKFAIISVGPNKFGHPNQVTLDYLKNLKVLRTDKHNALKVVSDGSKYKILGYDPSKRSFQIRVNSVKAK